ncbi:putative phosphatidylinositol class p [Rosellinia necatrix]|uniref:Putative phosphatidylinositol class p n=1 Tax=Rosellinia necatrix TaxID=77044 RepID=A0A1W2TJ26_ROSNE|nr:putative phosphatidylinositol class p [Rosellinia necatrix]
MSLLSEEEEEGGEAGLLYDNQTIASSSGDDNDDDDDDDDSDEPFPPPPLSHNYFAPPFYGRPPTPLPPSPSLTSLLRPSRPTTPDASDDDLEPVPRASPKVPTYEYYGFVVYLFSSLTFLMYLLWAYLPSPILHALGIYYYPNRWWALAVPSFITMLIVYIYVALALYNTEVLTLPLTSIETIVDEAAKIAVVDGRGRLRPRGGTPAGAAAAAADRREMTEETARSLDWKRVWNKGTDGVMDVPLAGVCEVLYGDLVDDDEEET